MKSNLNCKRIALGGLVGGLVLNVVCWIVHVKILMPRYAELTQMGFYLKEPKLPFMIGNPILNIVVGMMLAWFYAASRETLGPGPKTAMKVAIVAWFISFVPHAFAEASWSATGRYIPFVWMIGGLIGAIAATLVAGVIYKPCATQV